jgi:hypothetical protein
VVCCVLSFAKRHCATPSILRVEDSILPVSAGPAYPNLFSWSIQLYEPTNRYSIGRVSHLLSYSNHPSIRSHVVRSEKLPIVRLNAGLNHQWYKRAKRTGCIQCRVAIAHKKRAANAPSATKIERARQTECGCTICKVCTVP